MCSMSCVLYLDTVSTTFCRGKGISSSTGALGLPWLPCQIWQHSLCLVCLYLSKTRWCLFQLRLATKSQIVLLKGQCVTQSTAEPLTTKHSTFSCFVTWNVHLELLLQLRFDFSNSHVTSTCVHWHWHWRQLFDIYGFTWTSLKAYCLWKQKLISLWPYPLTALQYCFWQQQHLRETLALHRLKHCHELFFPTVLQHKSSGTHILRKFVSIQ